MTFDNDSAFDSAGEQAIRDAVRAVKSLTIGKPFPLTATFNGRTINAVARIDKIPSGGEQARGVESAVKFWTITAGRLLRDDPIGYVVNHYKLTGKNKRMG